MLTSTYKVASREKYFNLTYFCSLFLWTIFNLMEAFFTYCTIKKGDTSLLNTVAAYEKKVTSASPKVNDTQKVAPFGQTKTRNLHDHRKHDANAVGKVEAHFWSSTGLGKASGVPDSNQIINRQKLPCNKNIMHPSTLIFSCSMTPLDRTVQVQQSRTCTSCVSLT